ncbi:MAG: hypothetical protein E6J87_14225 [Deltaproteobacteria bacterium]|nr:MAG: hypothetical protein E6J87_14225 [Deltaproteobacteria bacterium]
MRALAAHSFMAVALLASGCFAPLKQLVNASAIEQEMTSEAIERSVASLQVEGIDHRPPYVLRIAAPTGVDTALIRARLQERLAQAEIRLQPETSKPEATPRGPTLLAVVPYAGVDSEATLIGVPFVVPGLPVAMGDISLYKSSTVTGRARVELSAWSADHAPVAALPAAEASRYYRNVTFLTFFGPFRFSNLDEDPLPGDEP